MHRRLQLSKGKPGVQPCINIKNRSNRVIFRKCRSVCKGYRGQDKSYIIYKYSGYLCHSYYILPGTFVYNREAFASSTLDLDLSMTVNNNDDFFFTLIY